MKKILLNPWTAIITLSILALLRVLDPSFVQSVRLRYFDEIITSQPKVDVPVHVVNIDEDTLDKFGQWPFPRNIYADIIQDLYKRDAGLVVFNVLMPEADRFRQDNTLAKVMQDQQIILPILGHTKSKNDAPNSSVQVVGQTPEGRVVDYPGLLSNVKNISQASAGVGIVNTFPEIDGVVRRMPLVIASQGQLYPALALETLRVAAQDPRVQVKIGDIGVEALRVPKFGRINTDPLSRVWIDWAAEPKQHSLAKLPDSFKGEIVIVGLSAAGLANPVATAKGEVWPHYLQGAVLGTMTTQSNIQRPEWADTAELFAIVALGMLIIAMARWVYVGIAFYIIIAIGTIWGSMYAYSHYKYLVDATLPALSILLIALHAYSLKFIDEFLQKQQIRKQFATYLSPDLVAKLVKNPGLLHLGGEEKELSIMFTDVRGFTGISEHYGKNVQGLTQIMNRYMTAMTRKILENNGTLDKYIGDAQMAFWNAPLDETLHCKEAVKAGLEMLGSLKEFNDEITKEGVPPFGMGIGINTGVVVVGNMGSEQRFDYTCLGDAVNLASRFEGQSKNYGVFMVIGEITAIRLGTEYFTLELDSIAVKGKKEGVKIFTAFYNPDPGAMPEYLIAREHHDLMLTHYRNQEWNKAIGLVTVLRGEFDGQMDHYYDLWLERIEIMKQANLPSDWDGVYHATSK